MKRIKPKQVILTNLSNVVLNISILDQFNFNYSDKESKGGGRGKASFAPNFKIHTFSTITVNILMT